MNQEGVDMSLIRTITRAGSMGLVFAAMTACGASASPPPASAPPALTTKPAAATEATSGNAKGIDPAAVAAATGGKPETSDKVVKVSFPRTDVPVSVDGWNGVPPFMGLTSWAAFTPGEKAGIEAMVVTEASTSSPFITT
jgi:hypothetical protein